MSVVINGSAGVTTNSGAVYNGIQMATALVSTSGTAVTFTSVPSWVNTITLMFDGVSTNGGSQKLIQIGSGSFTVTGYASASYFITGASISTASYTTGFGLFSGQAAEVLSGNFILSRLTGNVWTINGQVASPPLLAGTAGSVTLSGVLDRIRVTTANGTDAFDAGTINIMYE